MTAVVLQIAGPFRSFVRLVQEHFQLILHMAARETGDRYAGHMIGRGWAVLHPIILMGVYVFLFSFVFKVKISAEYDLPLDYTAYILSGLIPWLAFQDVLAKSSSVISGNANLVKQVLFPVEVLPLKTVIGSLLPLGVSLLVLVSYVAITSGSLPWTYALLPVAVAFEVLAMLGLGYLLAAAGAYFRDVKDVVQVLTLINMYLMPVFYLPMWVPHLFKPLLYVNPFSPMIWVFQDTLYFGRIAHPWAWVVFAMEALVVFAVGFSLFRRFKTAFGNVL